MPSIPKSKHFKYKKVFAILQAWRWHDPTPSDSHPAVTTRPTPQQMGHVCASSLASQVLQNDVHGWPRSMLAHEGGCVMREEPRA